MSKKQRERVEDEANFHKRRLNQVTATGGGDVIDLEADISATTDNTGVHLNR